MSGNFADRVIRRGEARYEEARRDAVFRKNIPDRFPEIIVLAETTEDVVAAVRLARSENLPIGRRSGGHSWTSPHLRDNSLLLDLSRLNGFQIDAPNKIAYARPGVKGLKLNQALGKFGLMFPGGHHNTVGLGGFLMCGGFGWNSRQWGNGCANVLEVEVVTAEGEVIIANDAHNQDYYWAARGSGSGFFGVVTNFKLRCYDRPPLVHSAYSFHLDVLEPLLTWTREVLPRVPRFVEMIASTSAYDERGNWAPQKITVSALSFAPTEEESRAALKELFSDCPVLDRAVWSRDCLVTTLDERYEGGTKADPEGFRFSCDNMYSNAPAEKVVPLMREFFTSLPTPRSHIFWQNWGPMQPRPDMALSVDADLYFGAYAIWSDPAQDERMLAWPVEQMHKLASIATGEAQMNDENMIGHKQRYMSEAASARLEIMRAKYDPEGRFLSFLSL